MSSPPEEVKGDGVSGVLVCFAVVGHVLCSLRLVFSAGLPLTIGSHTITHFSKANELLLIEFLELHNAWKDQRNVDALRAGNFKSPYVSS